MELPNIEMELERFKKKQYTARMRSNFWKVSMGIAAMIAVLFGTYNLFSVIFLQSDMLRGSIRSKYCDWLQGRGRQGIDKIVSSK